MALRRAENRLQDQKCQINTVDLVQFKQQRHESLVLHAHVGVIKLKQFRETLKRVVDKKQPKDQSIILSRAHFLHPVNLLSVREGESGCTNAHQSGKNLVDEKETVVALGLVPSSLEAGSFKCSHLKGYLDNLREMR